MAEYRKPPKPPLGGRISNWVHTNLGATIVGGIVAGIVLLTIGYLVFGQGGAGSNPSTTVVETGQSADTPAEAEHEPQDAVEEAAERPFWVSPPTTYPSAEHYDDGLASIDPVRADLLVGFPKEVFENPEMFVGKPFYIVGRVASQTPLAKSFYGRELLLVSGEPGYDAYVGATDYLTTVRDGEIVLARGRLAAEGETKLPGKGVLRSIYFLATFEGNGGDVESDILAPSSGTLKAAIKRVTEATK